MPEPSSTYTATEHSTPSRSRHRASYDRSVVHAILDEGRVCHLGFVRDGRPVVLPTLYARVGERIYVHGSTGSGPVRLAADGAEPAMPVCLTVTHVDGLVLARSAMHHSVNYRSVVVHGDARPVTDPAEKVAALDALVEQAIAGRSTDCRPADAKELAATAVLAVELREVSAKIRSGGPNDDAGDVSLPHWSGVLPAVSGFGAPVPADDLDPAVPVPGYLAALTRP
ncbi:pyridoxamine 5'-phosphate oxidase family protein [Streptomyces sparsus]